MKTKVIDAIYKDGVFKPLKKVKLKDGEKVRIRIEKNNLLNIISKYQKIFRLSRNEVDKYMKDRR